MNMTADIGKALSALAVSVCIAAALIVAPSFAPEVEAGVPHALAKSDKLEVRPLDASCEIADMAQHQFIMPARQRLPCRGGSESSDHSVI